MANLSAQMLSKRTRHDPNPIPNPIPNPNSNPCPTRPASVWKASKFNFLPGSRILPGSPQLMMASVFLYFLAWLCLPCPLAARQCLSGGLTPYTVSVCMYIKHAFFKIATG